MACAERMRHVPRCAAPDSAQNSPVKSYPFNCELSVQPGNGRPSTGLVFMRRSWTRCRRIFFPFARGDPIGQTLDRAPSGRWCVFDGGGRSSKRDVGSNYGGGVEESRLSWWGALALALKPPRPLYFPLRLSHLAWARRGLVLGSPALRDHRRSISCMRPFAPMPVWTRIARTS